MTTRKDIGESLDGATSREATDTELSCIACNGPRKHPTYGAATTSLVPIISGVTPERSSGSGTYASLTKRVHNWRQPIGLYAKKLAEMEDLVATTRKKSVKAYYTKQIEVIEGFITNDAKQRAKSIHPDDELEEGVATDDDSPIIHTHEIIEILKDAATEEENSSLIMWVTRGSLALNILLFVMKIALVVRSGSMAFVASLVDSALDLFSGAVMVIVAYAIAHSEERRYPTGKHKFEAIGTLIFACAMFIASAKVIEDCVNSLLDIDSVRISMEPLDYFFIGFVIVSKGIAHLLCRRCANVSATIEALADDHRNDVLTNGAAVLAVFAARYYSRYFDPAIGMATAFFMMFNWACTAYEQASALSGETASPEYLNALTMIALNHDPRVVAVDTVRAVTSGSGHLVEIDLLLPREMTLEEAHDIGERLQVFLENCEDLEVARAYVHLDYETQHNPFEHR